MAAQSTTVSELFAMNITFYSVDCFACMADELMPAPRTSPQILLFVENRKFES